MLRWGWHHERLRKRKKTQEAIFNISVEKAKLQTVDQIALEVTVLGTSETWLRKADTELTEALDGSVVTSPAPNLPRGHSAADIILNFLLSYKLLNKFTSNAIVAIIVKIRATVITVVYKGHHIKHEEEKDFLERINVLSSPQEILIEKTKSWDGTLYTSINGKGHPLRLWAAKMDVNR